MTNTHSLEGWWCSSLFIHQAGPVIILRMEHYFIFINAQDSLCNLIGQNVITWGVLTDGKDMAYQNQSSAYVPVVRQLVCVTRNADLNQSEWQDWHHAPDSWTWLIWLYSNWFLKVFFKELYSTFWNRYGHLWMGITVGRAVFAAG